MTKDQQAKEILRKLRVLNKQMKEDILNIDKDIARLDVAYAKDQIKEEESYLKVAQDSVNK